MNLKPDQMNELAGDANFLPKFYRKNGWWLQKCLNKPVVQEENCLTDTHIHTTVLILILFCRNISSKHTG